MGDKKPFFDAVDLQINFPAEEEKILKRWYENGIVSGYLKKNNSSKKTFSFLDGPITANNPMGVHHAWGRTYKDLWQRYKNMRGFRQRFQNGFDCQGLWVEVEVEKELGLRNKKDIENLVPGDKVKSIEKFVQLCRKRVKKYSDIQTDQSKRLGYFMDWDNSYFTLSENNNYMIWHFLKVCHDNGWIYKGHESIPWCPRCETAISQHEILTEDYKELTHESIILKFPIKGRNKEYLLVWTTTPWTIIANIAVAVDAKKDYALFEDDNGQKYWVAVDLENAVFKDKTRKLLKKVKGSQLVGLEYQSAFDDLELVSKVASENKGKFHTVVATDDRLMPISMEEGTGMVHTAVSAGEEDYRLGKKLGLPMIPVIADNADYLPGLGEFSGKNAKKDPRIILDYLESKDSGNYVFEIFKYKHRYPACWRCKEELVWKVADEWYIAMDRPSVASEKGPKGTLRERMKVVSKKINWIPSFGLDRELDWLNNMHDWLISKKNRYWGLALPIWECECGNFTVIGSRDELKDKSSAGWDDFDGKTPHKPQIDKVQIKCDKCGKSMDRIEAVGNPWLDAGIVSYSTVSKNNKACLFEGSSDEPEYINDKAEWQKWIPADFITESFPGQFKNWFYSLIAMSTVLENIEPFKTVLGYATLLAEDGRPMHKSWGNSIEFNEGAGKIGADVMRWMYMSTNPSDNMLFGYKIADETRRRFYLKIWNVYNFFITYANLENWKPSGDSVSTLDKKEVNNILDAWILMRLSQTLKEVEINLDRYLPNIASSEIEKFVEDLSNWYIRRSRERVGPAADDAKDKSAFYETSYFVLSNLSKLLAPFMPFMADLIYTNLTKKKSVHLEDWPSFKFSVDENVLSNMDLVREASFAIHSSRKTQNIAVRQLLLSADIVSTAKIPGGEFIKILKDEVNIMDVNWKVGKELAVKLDTTVTPELELQTKTRELIRSIQNQRKELGVNISDHIDVKSSWLPDDPNLLTYLKKKTLSQNVKLGDRLEVTKV